MVHRRWQQGLSWSRLSKCCGHVHHMTGEAIRSSELGGDQTDVDGPAAADAAVARGVGALSGLRGVAVRAVPPARRPPAAAAAQHTGRLVEVAQERQQRPRREPGPCLHPQTCQ